MGPQVANGEDFVWESMKGAVRLSGGERYLPLLAAEQFLDACVRASVAIVGIEVVAFDGEVVVPDLELIADFSSLLKDSSDWNDVVLKSSDAAHRFFERVAQRDLWLSFTLASRPA